MSEAVPVNFKKGVYNPDFFLNGGSRRLFVAKFERTFIPPLRVFHNRNTLKLGL